MQHVYEKRNRMAFNTVEHVAARHIGKICSIYLVQFNRVYRRPTILRRYFAIQAIDPAGNRWVDHQQATANPYGGEWDEMARKKNHDIEDNQPINILKFPVLILL